MYRLRQTKWRCHRDVLCVQCYDLLMGLVVTANVSNPVVADGLRNCLIFDYH